MGESGAARQGRAHLPEHSNKHAVRCACALPSPPPATRLHDAPLASADALQLGARLRLDQQAVVLLVLRPPDLQHCGGQARGAVRQSPPLPRAGAAAAARASQLPACRAARARTRHGGVAQLDGAHIDLGAQRVDDLLDDVAVAARALVVDLLDGVLVAQLHAGAHHAPELLRHLGVAALRGVEGEGGRGPTQLVPCPRLALALPTSKNLSLPAHLHGVEVQVGRVAAAGD